MLEVNECEDKNTIAPLLSVIVPIYNVEKYLKRCLDSIINQKYTNLQVICVDDGSTDNSGKIAEKYAELDSRVEVVHKKNGGLVSARKCGIKLAKGKYSTYVDSDDWIEEEMFYELMVIVLETGADVVTSGAYRDYGTYTIIENERIERGVYVNEGLNWLKDNLVRTDVFFQSNISVHLWNKIYTTDLLKKHQLFVDDLISIGEDAVVSLPIILAAQKVAVTGKCFYHYCLRPDSIMGKHKVDDSRKINALIMYIDRCLEEFDCLSDNIKKQSKMLKYYYSLFRDLENSISYSNNILYPFGKVKSTEKVLVYGAGKFGRELYDFLERQGWFSNFLWADKDGKNGAMCIEDIDIKSIDKVLVAVLLAEVSANIKNFLIEKGIDADKILVVKMFD